MKVSDAFPSKFLKAADLNGRTVRVKICEVKFEEIGQGDDKSRKPVIYFHGKEKGVALNKTNATNIALMYGDEMEDWIDAEVDLFPAMVDFQGRSVEAIRVKPVRPQRQTASAPAGGPPAGHPANLDDDVPFAPQFD